MADITPSPFALVDVDLTVEGDDFAAAVNSVTLTPSPSTSTFKGLKKGAAWTFGGASTWTLDIGGATDVADAQSLSNLFFDEEGEEMTFTFRPRSGGPGFEVDVIIQASAIGGAVDQPATFTVSLPVQGKPRRVVAVAP